jgi:ferrous iron transport protein B
VINVTVSAQSGASGGTPSTPRGPLRVALLGNPNVGKTTLFNALTGLRHHTSNFPGTTVEARVGWCVLHADQPPAPPSAPPAASPAATAAPPAADSTAIEVVDLPGIYSLELEQIEARVCRDALAGTLTPGSDIREPDVVCVVIDASNLARNLTLLGEALRRRLPTVVALTMVDVARNHGRRVDATLLAQRVGCPVLPINARDGGSVAPDSTAAPATTVIGPAGLVPHLRAAGQSGAVPTFTPPGDEVALRRWAEDVASAVTTRLGPGPSAVPAPAPPVAGPVADTVTDRLDRLLTHPVSGTLVFLALMAGLFVTIFTMAQWPMGWIESVFSLLSSAVGWLLPEGLLRELLTDGVVHGVGATVIFLPQICLLFFLISLLEDTGYLARAALVMDRVLRPFGLPGHAFVPLLSSHACALPGIMACRTIPDRTERLATILVAPFMTCSARLPVYVLLTGLLFPDSPLHQALAFIGCYALGMLAGVGSALLVRRTLLRGAGRPMAIELPSYKLPSLRTALLTSIDRGLMFLRKAGTTILAICLVLWWLGAFPKVGPSPEAQALRDRAAALVQTAGPRPSDTPNTTPNTTPSTTPDPALAPQRAAWTEHDNLLTNADALQAAHAKANSYLGMVGRAAQPAFEPLGLDWRLTIGVMASFAAREVFVSTMSVVITGREEDGDAAPNITGGIRHQLATALRDDGRTLVFERRTCWVLLVFYVLSMQCLPTLVVTARESGSAKWALLQLTWMTGLAYALAWLVGLLAA